MNEHRLLRNLLFKMAKELGHVCYRCHEPLGRADFSLDHIIPWRESGRERELFEDPENIAFSHQGCNSLHHRLGSRLRKDKPITRMRREERLRRIRVAGYTPAS